MSTLNHLYGLWQMTAMRFQTDDGQWESETVYGGTSIFTSDGLINTFTRAEIAFGYSGSFTMKGNEMVIRPVVCSIPELEGKTITREIKKLDAESLTLAMFDQATGRNYEIEFRILARKFA